MIKEYVKGETCVGWYHGCICPNIQSNIAKNGLCDKCEEDRILPERIQAWNKRVGDK